MDSNKQGATTAKPLRSISMSVLAATRTRSGALSFFSLFGGGGSTPGSSNVTEVSSSGCRGDQDGSQWVKATLCLTDTKLCYDIVGQVCTVLLEDLIGVQVASTPPHNNPNACAMNITHYPKVPKWASSNMTRKLTSVTLQFDSKPGFKDNLSLAMDWKKAIILQTQQVMKKIFYHTDSSSVQLSEDESVVAPRHLLVILNPVSGPGKSVSEFKQHVQPLFDLAEISYTVIVTERQNHAREFMKTYNMTSIHGIVISSGDGLFHEVLNGIMEREDWETAIKVPIGMLPTGSGNALVASIFHESEEEFDLLNAVLHIIRGGVIPTDIATVQMEDGRKCYMTQQIAWGIVADADVETVKFRMLGEARYYLGGLNCILKRRRYKGKISYLPWNTDSPSVQQISTETSMKVPNASTKCGDTEDAIETDPADGSQISQPEHSATNETSARAPYSEAQDLCSPLTVHSLGPEVDLPPISGSVPSNWKSIEGEFICVTPFMIPLTSKSFYGDPTLPIGSGKIRIGVCDGHLTRLGMLELIIKTTTGQHLEMEGVWCIDVKAFRLEPHATPTMLTIDGEEVNCGVLQCQIHPGLARLMCRRRQLEHSQA